MTLVLLGKGLCLEGSTPKTEDKQLAGKYPMDPISFEGAKLVFSKCHKKQGSNHLQENGCIVASTCLSIYPKNPDPSKVF